MKRNCKKSIRRALCCCLGCILAVSSIFGHFTASQVRATETYTDLDRSGWSLSVYSQYASDPATNMIDGNTATMWETDWATNANIDLPVEITVDLGEIQANVCQVRYLPRQDGQANGKITSFEIYTGETSDAMTLACKGTWDTTTAEKSATFSSTSARYVTVKVLAAAQNIATEQTVTCAELNIATCAGVTVSSAALDAKITQMQTRISETDNELVKELLQAELDAVQSEDRQSLSQEGYDALISRLDYAMEHYTDGEFLELSQENLSVAYKTSAYSGNPVSYIFDGDSGTFWETDWSSGAVLFQSGDYFIIDLGQSWEDVARVTYTPRQDSSNGRIKEYAIYTSNAASLSGSDLSSNGFTLAGKGTWSTDAITKTATFNSATARYIAVVAYSVGGDGSTITCAELNVSLKKDMTVDTSAATAKLAQVRELITTTDSQAAAEKLQEVLDSISADVENYTQEGIEALITELDEAILTYGSIGHVSSIRPGATWVDTDGERIQAHGSNIIYDENTKTYYWYGEHKGADNIYTGAETGTPAIGVSCYSSKDLYNWTNEGVALPVFNNPQIMDGTATDDTPLYLSEDSPAYPNSGLSEFVAANIMSATMKSPVNSLSQFNDPSYIDALNALYSDLTLEEKQEIYAEFNWNRVVERPKVVYNRNTGKYVMWWHQDGPTVGQYTVASAGVAISDSPTGPFKYLDTFRLPNTGNTYGSGGEGMLRDMTLFVDDDGTGYVIYSSEDNATTIIYKLNKEYTAPSGTEEGTDYVRVFPGQYREAPAVFKDGDTYYMVTSGQSGWNPNPCKYAYSTTGIMGSWSTPEYFCEDDITMNDEPAGSQSAGTTFRSQSTNILAVRDEDGNIVPGKFIYMGDRWFREDLKDSRYIWLPLELDTETHTMTMSWQDAWTIEDLLS